MATRVSDYLWRLPAPLQEVYIFDFQSVTVDYCTDLSGFKEHTGPTVRGPPGGLSFWWKHDDCSQPSYALDYIVI